MPNLPLPHVTSFFGCLGLEAGARVAGFTHLLTSVFGLVYMILFSMGVNESIGTEEDIDDLFSKWFSLSVTTVIFAFGHIGLAITLICSIFKRYARGVCVWVYVMLVMWILGLVLIVVATIMTGFNGSGSEIFLGFLECVFTYSLMLYCILTVNSYYMMLKSAEDMQGPPKVVC